MLIQWRSDFEIDVPKVDAEHRHLVGIVNSFYDLVRSGAGHDKVYTVLNLLARYTEFHFASEEALMDATGYPARVEHRARHEALVEQIFALNERRAQGDEHITRETIEFLKKWLLDHILEEDKRIGEFLRDAEIPIGWADGTADEPI